MCKTLQSVILAMEKVLELHPLGGTVVKLKHVDDVEPKKLSKNQRKKLLRGYYSKENILN
jgi:hypothetical protein